MAVFLRLVLQDRVVCLLKGMEVFFHLVLQDKVAFLNRVQRRWVVCPHTPEWMVCTHLNPWPHQVTCPHLDMAHPVAQLHPVLRSRCLHLKIIHITLTEDLGG